MQTKTCFKCKRELNIENFNKNSSSKDGLCSYCRDCSIKHQKEYKENPDIYREFYGKHKIINNIEYKFCTTCHNWIELDKFSKRKDSKDGYRDQCKDCRNKNYKKWADNNIKNNLRQKDTIMHKICTKCGKDKNISEFNSCLTNPDGFQYWCKSCRIEYKNENKNHILEVAKLYRERPEVKEYMKNYTKKYLEDPENKQRALENSRKWQKENLDRIKKYYEENKEEIKAKNRIRGKLYRDSEKYKSQNEVIKRQIYHRKWYEKRYAERLEQQRKYEEFKQTPEFKEQQRQKAREYYYSIPKEKRQEKAKKYRLNNLEEIRLKDRIRYEKNKLTRSMSKGICQALKENKAERHWEELVNYTFQELKGHLESQFTPEMTWSNYGSYWEIDHIIPQNTFSFKTEKDKDFKICWSLMNLRPLEKIANRRRPKDGSDISEELKQQILTQF